MLSALRRASAPRTTTSLAKVAVAATSRRGFISSTDDYGSHLFTGAVADEFEYLSNPVSIGQHKYESQGSPGS